LNRPVEALVYFDRVLAIQPSSTRWANKAVALMRLNRGVEALDCIEQALALDPNDQSAQQLKTIVAAQMGDSQSKE
jgi:Flp pilus assembly protein TadD